MRNSRDILTLSAAKAKPAEETSAVAAAPPSSRRREIRSLLIMRFAPTFPRFRRSSAPKRGVSENVRLAHQRRVSSNSHAMIATHTITDQDDDLSIVVRVSRRKV